MYHDGAVALHVAAPPPREGVADELGVVGVSLPRVAASDGDGVEVAVEGEEPLCLWVDCGGEDGALLGAVEPRLDP